MRDIVSNLWHVRDNRIFEASDIDPERLYDFVLVPSRQLAEDEKLTVLRKAVEDHLRVRIVHAKRSIDGYVLSALHGKSAALREVQINQSSEGQIIGTALDGTDRELSGDSARITDLCEMIERFKEGWW